MSITRSWSALLLCALPMTGCAAILGLDSGSPQGDGGVDEQEDDAAEPSVSTDASTNDSARNDAAATDASTVADTSSTCVTGTADCNGNRADGCETNLNDPMHCGSCTKVCLPMAACVAEACCMPEHAACLSNTDCCSGNCGPGGSGCKK